MKALVLACVAIAAAAPRAHAKGCHEVSNVVGYEHCSRFGAWSRDQPMFPLRFEWGWLHQDFPTHPFTLPDVPIARVASERGMQNTVTDGVAMRYLGGNRLFYGGIELDTSGLVQEPQFAGLPASGVSWSIVTIEGLHWSWWRFSLGAELATGLRVTVYSYCGDQKSCALMDTEAGGVVEARVRAELFPTQHWSVGAMLGHSLIDATDRSFMVFTALHFRALDGMY